MLRLKKATLALPTISLVKALATQPSIQSTSRVSFSPIPAAELKQRDLNPLAGRKYLPGSWSQTFPKYLANPRKDFPYALQVENVDKVSFAELGKLCREKLDANLSRSGVILFRGTCIQNSRNFKEFTQALGYQAAGYEGGTGNRQQVDTSVYSSTDDPMDFNIELHNEMACSTIYPKKVMFACLTPPGPESGGLTPISKNSEILASLDPEVVDILKKRKIRYLRYLPDAKENPYASWQQSFVTEDKKTVDDFLQRAGFHYTWGKENNSLFYWYVLDPFIPHPVTGELIWFNQVNVHHNTYYKESPMFEGVDMPNEMWPTHAQYGDGTEVEKEVLNHVRSANWANAVGFDWREGDVMVCDNVLAQHGRLSFSGPRKLLAHLTNN
ncbi:uncharacterized protein LOC110253326 [Exaiptasia diaphana]|uniref:TauD/TfdA-like domain-containing protein n=1 Tax=Exaiptasia diaphana TaxID=2652724 RepID=A0A913Y8M0_EXADI|nr:uncharacterized protein LOC110253326 [Exaiptasia diaphana]XP_020915882.1 uncharacterized protein LOC110253326 [Exaiptasia diaphana]XP_020915883.1 uncharacterized protein LOC110253326 [Exaiptasia diaphana]KXJ21872.1 Clavaminate synthase-like protein [Exaiptasia diaphana]